MAKWGVFPEAAAPPRAVSELADRIERDGGHVLGCYQEPLKDAWQIFALLPLERVKPTPYQRDLSKPHVKRLQEVMKKLGRFVDPVVVVPAAGGEYWTPNGNHRREALTKLKADDIPVIVIPEPEVAYQILALNTEKAHNVKEKSLEVIRMYRGSSRRTGPPPRRPTPSSSRPRTSSRWGCSTRPTPGSPAARTRLSSGAWTSSSSRRWPRPTPSASGGPGSCGTPTWSSTTWSPRSRSAASTTRT